MKARVILSLALAVAVQAVAQTADWLHIIVPGAHKGTESAYTFPPETVEAATFISTEDAPDRVDALEVRHRAGCDTIALDNIIRWSGEASVPTIYIDTDDPSYTDVESRTEYLEAKISMDAYGQYENLSTVGAKVRGRGNSSWHAPKKPYRIKFDKKQSLCELPAAKSYVLLANWVDGSHLRHAIGLECARLMGMPFTNTAVPVEVVFNGQYKGAYLLTTKPGISKASIDIPEETGIAVELDVSYNEEYQYKSNVFAVPLPVQFKDPDFQELAEKEGGTATADSIFEYWKNDFEKMLKAVRYGARRNICQYVDLRDFARYMLVNSLTCNGDINYPKSVKIYKASAEDVYHFGPVWDFDWAFGYNHGEGAAQNYIHSNWGAGFLYHYIEMATGFLDILNEEWQKLRDEVYPALLDFIDRYEESLRLSPLHNNLIWPTDRTHGSYTYEVRLFMEQRIRFMESDLYRGIREKP